MQHTSPITMPTAQLHPDPQIQQLYPTHTPEQFEALTRHIEQHGILIPLIVRPYNNQFLIVDGATRHRIAQELNLPAVPCFVCESELDVVAAMFLNLHRRHLTPEDQRHLAALEQDITSNLKPKLDHSLLTLLDQFPLHQLPFFGNKQFWWNLSAGSETDQSSLATKLTVMLEQFNQSSHPASAQDQKLLEDRNRLAKKVSDYQDTITELHAHIRSLQEQLDEREATLKAWTAPNSLANGAGADPPSTNPESVNRFIQLNLQAIHHLLDLIEDQFTRDQAGAIDRSTWQSLGKVTKRLEQLIDKGQRLPAEFKLRLIEGRAAET